MSTQSSEILRDLAALLAYHESSGIDTYPGSEGLQAFLKGPVEPPQKPALPVRSGGKPVAPVPGMGKAGVMPQKPSKRTVVAASGSVGDLVEEVKVCRNCSLAADRVVPVAGRGTGRIRMLVVGDWLTVDRPGADSVFGIEQDLMLGRMFEAIKLPSEDVYVTNIIKCGIPKGKQPTAEHVNACYGYLQRQISSLRPELILAMGLLPARFMLKRKEPLSRLRGRLHQFDETGGGKIPLIATYHPTFLLQNSGMKSATWVDLKLVARQLGLPV